MSFVRRNSLALALLFATAATLVGGTADAAKAAAPKLSGLQARVAQGGKVDLAASAWTTAELAALRPRYEDLKPRVRGNAE
jgi:hypothetical protein